AYVSEDEKEAALLDEDLDGEDSAQEGEEPAAKFICQEKDFAFLKADQNPLAFMGPLMPLTFLVRNWTG
ncbi:unnamed protein product, partial [Tetraodon nigroviridis]